MPHPPLYQLIVVAAVVMGLSHTIAKERIFARIRDRLGGKETFCGYLVSCPYCNSHWLAFVLVPLTGTFAIRIPWQWGFATTLIDWFLSSILVTVLAAVLRVIFYLVDEQQGLLRREIQKTAAETRVVQRVAGRDSLDEHVPSLHGRNRFASDRLSGSPSPRE